MIIPVRCLINLLEDRKRTGELAPLRNVLDVLQVYAGLSRVTAHRATALCKDRNTFNGPGNHFQSFTVLSIVGDQYLLDGGILVSPIVVSRQGLKPRRGRVRPLEPKVPGDFFQAVGICWKINLGIV